MSQSTKFHQVNLRVDNDAALIFQHSLVKGGKPLTIRSGANQITWGYSLLTKVTPTYGGEVQQILGARIEQLEITGQTRDNHQLEQIYDWFRAYMTMASGFGHDNADGDRNELPITFSYPARRWQFDIQVTDATGFAIGTGLVATPWTIKAIIVPHGENQGHILEKTTMNDLTSVLLPKGGIPIGVGYNVQNPYSDAAYGGNEAGIDALGHTIGTNFQRLLGAYSVGDFSRFAFEGAAPSSFNNLNQESKDYWTSIYGTDIIPLTQGGGGQNMTGDGGTTGGVQYKAGQTKYPDPTGAQFNKAEDGPDQLLIVAWMASNAIKLGIPPLIPIMCGITESHLCNLDSAHSDPTPGTSSEGFFQQQHQFYDAEYPGYATNPDLQIRAFLTKILQKKSQFPGAQNEATQNAHNLGDWIQSVQLSGPNDYHKNYDQAKSLLNQSSVAVAGGLGSTPSGPPVSGSIREKAIGWAKWHIAQGKNVGYSQSRSNEPQTPRLWKTPPGTPTGPPQPHFYSDCSATCINCYVWAGGTNPGAGATGTMLTRLNPIDPGKEVAGDMVVIGSGDGHHAMFLLEKKGSDWNCLSHGGPDGNPPHFTLLSHYGSEHHTFLRWPQDIDKAP